MLLLTLSPNRLWRWLLPFLLGAVLLIGTIDTAQAQVPQHVIVTLRDAANRGLDQVVVTLRDPAGTVFAEGVTNRDGAARLALPVPAILLRLTVQGVSATGTPLQLAGSERDGIAVRVNGPETTIALRVEDDGTVLPDPATMAEAVDVSHTSGETAQPSARATPAAGAPTLPTVVRPSASPETTVLTVQHPAPAEFVDANGEPVSEPSPAPSGLASSLVLLLILAIVAGGIWRILRPVRGGQR